MERESDSVEFDSRMIVEARNMGQFILVKTYLGFSRATSARVCQEYVISG